MPDAVKRYYLEATRHRHRRDQQIDGDPHRVLRTELVDELEGAGSRHARCPRSLRNALRFRKLIGHVAATISPRRAWR